MSISSQAVIGTAGATDRRLSGRARRIRSDQFSQVEVTSTQLTGGQWIGAGGAAAERRAERLRRDLLLEHRQPGADAVQAEQRRSWTQLGSTYNCGAAGGRDAAAGDRRSARTISFLQNGVHADRRSPTPASPAARRASWPTATARPTTGPAAAPVAAPIVLGRRDGLGAVGHGGAAGQRRRRPERERERRRSPSRTKLASGAAYSVTVKTNPAGQTCTVANGSGTIGSANVTNVAVTCAKRRRTYSVGGTVSGLSGTVVLQDNGGDDLSVSANGAFTFAHRAGLGAAYSVTVKTNPAGQTCTVANGSGTVGSANVTNVAVTCAASHGGQRLGRLQPGRWGPRGELDRTSAMARLSISSQAVTGTSAAATTGDIRTAETLRQRSVLTGRGDLDPADRRASGSARRCGSRTAGRTPTSGSTTGTTAVRS